MKGKIFKIKNTKGKLALSVTTVEIEEIEVMIKGGILC